MSIESIKEFVATMTFWNWLTLVSFFFLPFGVLNSFLGLKSRYADWRAVQGKLSFEDRLTELISLLKIQSIYRDETSLIVADLAKNACSGVVIFIAAVYMIGVGFAFAPGLQITSFSSPWISQLFISFGFLGFLYLTYGPLARTAKELRYFIRPRGLVREIFNLTKKGIVKGYLLDPVDTIGLVLKSYNWSEGGKEIVQSEAISCFGAYKEPASANALDSDVNLPITADGSDSP